MEGKILKIAEKLIEAEDNAQPIEMISKINPNFTIEEAYKIQEKVFELKTKRGERIIGKKIGLTNEAIREQVGVYEPDFSLITDKNYLNPNDKLDLNKQINPKLEPELAFVMKKNLDQKIITNWDVINAIEGIMPAFEIVDTRFGKYNFTIIDTISDSASYGKIIVGNSIKKVEDLNLETLGMSLYKNGKLIRTASSAEVMGNPINSVTWLANKMLQLGNSIKKGDIILSGSFTPVFDINKGDIFEAVFDKIGKVRLEVNE